MVWWSSHASLGRSRAPPRTRMEDYLRRWPCNRALALDLRPHPQTGAPHVRVRNIVPRRFKEGRMGRDRKSTRLNSSHGYISYAVFCLKKKKKKRQDRYMLVSETRT